MPAKDKTPLRTEDLARRLAEAQADAARLSEELNGARRALAESRSRYKLIIDSIVDYAIIATDLDGQITLWTESAATLFGWPESRMLGRSIEEIFTEADVLSNVPRRVMRDAMGRNASRQERWHRRADGLHFFASGEAMLLRNEHDALAGFLHILRDRTEERRIQHELEASRERLEYALSTSSLVGTYDWDVVNDLVYTDDKFRAFFGLPTVAISGPLPIERFIAPIHPEDREQIWARIQASVRSGTPLSLEYRIIDGAGRTHWVSAQGGCFNDVLGNPIRLAGAVIDISREKRREARQAALLRLGDEDLREVGDEVDYPARTLAMIGETLELGYAGYSVISPDRKSYRITAQWTGPGCDALPAQGRLGWIEQRILERLRKERLLVVEDIALHPATREHADIWSGLRISAMCVMAVVEDGEVRMLLFLFSPLSRQWEEEELGFVRDILNRGWAYSGRRLAEKRLIEAETRLRLSQEAADIGTLDYVPDVRRLDLDARARSIFDLDPDAPTPVEGFLDYVLPEDRDALATSIGTALEAAEETELDLQFRILAQRDGGVRHVRLEAQTVAAGGRIVRMVGAVRDVTDVKTAEERQAQLTRELRHRVNNTLGMVDALARLTLRRAASAEEGLEAFQTRLAALKQAHEVLTQTSWTSAPIQGIVERSVGGMSVVQAGRIGWHGPDIRLSARQSFALSLALHELACNAVRHGALRGAEGHVDIAWEMLLQADGPHVRFTWREAGGAPIEPPTRFGLGLKLLRQSLPIEIGGKVRLVFPPEGAMLEIEAPIMAPEDDPD